MYSLIVNDGYISCGHHNTGRAETSQIVLVYRYSRSENSIAPKSIYGTLSRSLSIYMYV